MRTHHKTSTAWAALATLAAALGGSVGHAQPGPAASATPAAPADPDAGKVIPDPKSAPGNSEVISKDWKGAVRVLRIPGASGTGAAEAKAAREIFPESDKVWMHVYGADPAPVEAARRGARRWICSGGCELTLPADSGGDSDGGATAAPSADSMLKSIKVQTPSHPLPLTIWHPVKPDSNASESATGKLLFDPKLLGVRDYHHVCAHGPVIQRAKLGAAVESPCHGRPPATLKPQLPQPDQAEIRLGYHWPRTSELSDFQYLAIVDQCGNARVQPFQRIFSVPVRHVSGGGCGRSDGRVLRVFPSGGFMRITAFNLDAPAAGNVVSATFRVSVPPLEDLVSADSPKMLFPDPNIDQLRIDCGPRQLRAMPGPGGIPRRAPPSSAPPPAKGSDGAAPTKPPSKDSAKGQPDKPPIVKNPRGYFIPSGPKGQPMAHQGLVIGPDPLLRGDCRIDLAGQTKRRLVAPLALWVRIIRTDKPGDNEVMAGTKWIVTKSDSSFRIPPLSGKMDGESRLVVEVYSDPLSPEGNMVLLSDAPRYARKDVAHGDEGKPGRTELKRLIGSVTVHTAPLCGDSNFETVAEVGSCIRGYFTVPAMLATLQITRAPWMERPLITRSVLSAVGVAFALDSYDPVERRAFPIGFQLGGFVQDLGENRLGLTSYLGVAPTVPILGEGGNTTSIGLLGGIGMSYITRSDGPDEGFKPAAFLSVIVQIGQANPALQGNVQSGGTAFGAYQPGTPPTGTE